MLIAEVNGERCKATKGAKGICPYCKSEVIAKCGEQKVAHWAHKASKECDSWHDKETEWHLMWKNYFPESWQEIIKYDEKTGEKHIADVCTEKGFTLEFQHSAIKPEERKSREAFYKNMNWVVDCTRCKRDFERFIKNIGNIGVAKIISPIVIPTQNNRHVADIIEVDYPEYIFPKCWLNSDVPVIFDFRGLNQLDNPADIRHRVFCLLPLKNGSKRYAIQVLMGDFIGNAVTGGWEIFVNNQTEKLEQYIKTYKRII